MSFEKEDPRLGDDFKKLLGLLETHSFEDTWRAATRRSVDPKPRPSPFRWALGPILATSAVVVAMIISPSVNPVAPAESLARLDSLETDLGDVRFLSDTLDGVEIGSYLNDSSLKRESTGTQVAYRSLHPGQDLFVADTDFLLTYTIPSWDLDVERKL